MNTNLPKRKPTRLRKFDYSAAGAYFVTICVKDRSPILSNIVVGDGAHDVPQKPHPHIELSSVGHIVEKHLLGSVAIPGVIIDQYVIMPDHIHAIIIIMNNKSKTDFTTSRAPENGTSRAPSPTNEMLPHVISVFKRFCNLEIGKNIFQRGYYDHIIRDQEDYETRRKYIYENPMKRYYRS